MGIINLSNPIKPYFSIYAPSNITTWTNGAVTKLLFGSTDSDDYGHVSGSTFTAKKSGVWLFTVRVFFFSSSGGLLNSAYLYLYKNGVVANTIYRQGVAHNQGTASGASVSAVLRLEAGDTVALYGELATATGTTNVCGFAGGTGGTRSNASDFSGIQIA